MAYNRILKRINRRKRLARPSPAEDRFLKLLGGRPVKLFGITIFYYGWWLFRHRVKREIMIAGYCIDFGIPALKVGIEIDGRNYHDVVYDYNKDEVLKSYGWIILRIPAYRVYRYGAEYAEKARRFLSQ